MLEASSGSLKARDLVLVSDASIVMKTSPKQALVYFCDALSGAPISNANVSLWESYYANSKWRWRRLRQHRKDGIAVFALKGTEKSATSSPPLQPTNDKSFSSGHATNPAAGTCSPGGLRVHRSSGLSAKGNGELEDSRAALCEQRLFHAG